MRKATIMKTLLCLCLLTIPLGMSAQGEKVTLSLKDVPLTSALRQVEQQSGYYKINYPSSEVSRFKVTTDMKNMSAPDAVKELLRGLPFASSVNGQFIQIRRTNRPETRTLGNAVRGRILDNNGDPLIGVTVQVEGTNKGTITDYDGNFELDGVQEGTLLTYSYVGKRPLKRRAGYKPVVIILEDESSQLDDVVVTGYQTISKERTTGAFNKIDVNTLNERPTSDLSSALQGLVAGMQATENEDGSVSFKIRGQSTLYADANPLVVVDGFPIEGSFSSINPNDVESVTILKDASAASIWGARSANGVIVVTTKKAHDKKLTVGGKAFWRIQTNPDLDYILNQADSRSTVDFEIRALENGWDMGSSYAPSVSNLYGTPLSLAQQYYFANKYYGMSEAEMKAGLESLRNTSNRQQLKDYLMQTALLQQYNVTLSGGSDKISNYLSLMYEKNDERTVNRGYNRFMLNYNNEYRINKIFTASAAATLQKRSQDFSGVTLQEFTNLSPYELLLNNDGSYVDQVYEYNNFELEKIDRSSFPYENFRYNMLEEVRNRTYKTASSNYRVQLGLNAKILEGLTYDIKYQYERNEYDTNQYDNEETYYTRSTVNFYSDFDTSNLRATKSYLPAGGIKRSSSSVNFNDVLRNQLNFDRIFGKHDITAIAGIEMSRYVTRETIYPTVYGFSETTNTSAIPYYGQNDNIGNIMNYSANNSTYFNSLATTYADREDRYISYYGNAAYMYDERYGVTFSIRSDGSNFISKDTSLRWSPMWSVGLKWNAHKESFLSSAEWINRLSFRATYGLNGNAEKSTSTETLISASTSSIVHSTIANVVSYGNPLLKWERTKTFNAGVDFSFFRNVLSGKVDVYSRKSFDVIGSVVIPSVYGTSSQRFNNAEISNKGIEMELTGNFKIPSIGLGVKSTVTYSYNKNRIEKLYNPSIYCYQLVLPTTFVEGRSIGGIYSYEFVKTVDGIPYVKGVNGEPSSMNELTLHNTTIGLDILDYSGTTVPPHTLGWNTQLSWKGLQLSLFLTGNFGAVFRAPMTYIPPVMSKVFVSKQIELYEVSDGTLYPTWPNANEVYMYRWDRYIPNLSYFVESADFIKLKEIDLSWNIPRKWLNKVHIQNMSLFVQARDLGILWAANQYDYDPEWLPGTNRPSTSVTMGVNIHF